MTTTVDRAGRADLQSLAPILSRCFNVSLERAPDWLERAGQENVRVVKEGGAVAGGAFFIPMGQWFGGRRVGMEGVAAVGVAPERRGRGTADALMRGLVKELHERGVPISTLFPATLPLYRGVGYEIAGLTPEVKLPLVRARLSDRTLTLRPATGADHEAVRALYARVAPGQEGALDRNEYIWKRVFQRGEKTMEGTLALREGALEGYVYCERTVEPDGRQALEVTDLCVATPAAARSLLTFFLDHHSLTSHVTWRGAPPALLLQIPEVGFTLGTASTWMVRIVDVAAALAARGYPRAVRGTLSLAVRDPLLPANDGPFLLEVEEGRGTVRRGGEGRLAVDIRGLSPLYTGYASPDQLHAAGLLDGPAPERHLAAALFAGPSPSLADMF